DAHGSANGRREDGFRGFARACADADGRYAILTVRPGNVPDPDGAAQAPHLDVSVFARGLLKRLVTRIYFPEEGDANDADPVLSAVDPARRATLIAELAPNGSGYAFDVRLQGKRETVFFDLRDG